MCKPLLFSFKVFVFISLEIIFPLYSFAQHFSNEKILDTTAFNLYSQSSGGSLTVDDAGNLYVTWIDETVEWTILNIAKSTDHGQTFTKTVVDSMSVYTQIYFYNPIVLIDKKSNLWLANYYWDSFAGYLLIQIRKSTDGGVNFYTKNLDYSGPDGFDMDSDSLGNIYIIWQPWWGPPRCTKFVAGNLNNSFETIIPGITFETQDYRIAVHEENIFIVFSARLDPNLYIFKTYYTKSFDGGLTFSSPERIDTSIMNSTDQQSPDIYSWNDRISISWIDNRNGFYSVYYRESSDDGNSFTDVEKVSTYEDRNVGVPGIAGNSSILGLVWCTLFPTQADIFFCYKNFQSGIFSAPERVGDPLYQHYNQYLEDISADKEGYIYILFTDDRLSIHEYLRLYLSIAKFEVSNIEKDSAPPDLSLFQNYPNPFNPNTKIKYSVSQTSQVQIKVYDVLGNEIKTLVNEEKQAGSYEIMWNAFNLPSGVYFYQLKATPNGGLAGDIIQTKKMIMMK